MSINIDNLQWCFYGCLAFALWSGHRYPNEHLSQVELLMRWEGYFHCFDDKGLKKPRVYFKKLWVHPGEWGPQCSPCLLLPCEPMGAWESQRESQSELGRANCSGELENVSMHYNKLKNEAVLSRNVKIRYVLPRKCRLSAEKMKHLRGEPTAQ